MHWIVIHNVLQLVLGNTTYLIPIPIQCTFVLVLAGIQYRTIPIPVLDTTTLEPGIGSIDICYLVSPSTSRSGSGDGIHSAFE